MIFRVPDELSPLVIFALEGVGLQLSQHFDGFEVSRKDKASCWTAGCSNPAMAVLDGKPWCSKCAMYKQREVYSENKAK